MGLRQFLREGARARSAMEGFPWFRAGYYAALADIERTGLRPIGEDQKRRCADRALKQWIEEPVK